MCDATTLCAPYDAQLSDLNQRLLQLHLFDLKSNDQEWIELEQLAAALSTDAHTPSAGQVASTLLSLSMSDVWKQLVAADP